MVATKQYILSVHRNVITNPNAPRICKTLGEYSNHGSDIVAMVVTFTNLPLSFLNLYNHYSVV
jgi:hypothetical protein